MTHPDIIETERTGYARLEHTRGEFTCCVTVTGAAEDVQEFRETVEQLGHFDGYTIKFISEPELNAV